LTRTNDAPLPFAQPQPARERDRCRDCRKHNRKPSSVVANVKVYKRRMSQWSLDNLNRGKKAGRAVKKILRRVK
jgi:hypothetical protein